ncbi:MAG: aminodeoxychorismate/anthranilate synthase component II [Candidatus Sumerlaeota bacterium]|nr:aminodeoxychorismate/anthranilate synthase component II [Candidatus Sumerlaeota bacterium]
MILVIDNYDSFTYNLVQFMGELGAEMKVVRNDQFRVEAIAQDPPAKIVISPGPCTPNEAGLSCEVIRRYGAAIPILGVCLGHQCIGQVFGGQVVRAEKVMHGKTSMIHHNGQGVFAGVDNPFEATRYHSLIVKRDTLPECFEITAWTDDGLIMGLRHKTQPVYGVQFHPESILTKPGKQILGNFLHQAL